MKRTKLFCLPYAGGTSNVFNSWYSHLDKLIDLTPIELAGRGARIDEPLSADFDAVIDDVVGFILREASGSYAIFGHSLGAKIAYHVAQRIINDKLRLPEHVFFSGIGAPHVKDTGEIYHLLEDSEFKERLKNMGGTPPSFFDYPELVELFLPVLKNDFMLSETIRESENINPMPFDISVYIGKDDELSPDQCDGWKFHTRCVCNMHYFEGGHFFLNSEVRSVLKLLNRTLCC